MKIRINRFILILFLLFCNLFLVFSFGKKENEEPVKEEIVFWNIGVDEPQKSIYGKNVQKYNLEYTGNFNITNIPTLNDAYKEKLLIAMSSGECPDMYTSWAGGSMYEYIDAGFAQPIGKLFANSKMKDKILDAAIAQGSYNGKLYSIGFLNTTISGIFYNKDIFQKYNLSVPSTISELESLCDKLVDNGIIPFAIANEARWPGSQYFMNLATRKGGLEPFKNAVDGKGSFEDECFIWAGNKIREYVKKGYFPKDVNSLSEDAGQARELLYAEKAAMTLIGSWYTGIIKSENESFYSKIDWFPFPQVDNSQVDSSIVIGTTGDQFISFNCTGEKLEAAFEMVELLFEDESVKSMVEVGQIPPVKNVDKLLTDNVTKKILAAVNNASSTQLWYDQYLPLSVAQVHLNTCQQLFGLMISAELAAEEFQDAMVKSNKEK